MLSEFLSLLSCLLNVLAGGQREITFSAASWELYQYSESDVGRLWGAKRVCFVNGLNRLLTGEEDHCRKAWIAHLEFWQFRLGRENSNK